MFWKVSLFKDGNSALLLAVESNNHGACRELLKSRCEEQLSRPNIKTGNYPLHIVVEKNSFELVRFLLGKGALPSTYNVSNTFLT